MGPEQSKRCKIRVHRLGLFSFSSRKIQNLTQKPPRDSISKQNIEPCRQVRGLWIYTSVRHNREIFGLLWFKNNNPILSAWRKWRKKNICATFAIYTITVVPYFGRKISSTSISMLLSQAIHSTWESTSPGVRPKA